MTSGNVQGSFFVLSKGLQNFRFQISKHDRCEETWSLSACWNFLISPNLHIWHACNVENFSTMHNLCCVLVKLGLLWFTLFCRKLCFATIHTNLCGEKWKICNMLKKGENKFLWNRMCFTFVHFLSPCYCYCYYSTDSAIISVC